ncbi:MAG: hypothetical protein ACRDDY_02405, partial [Clostridium sp.]|uniref:hypothetical protein n=1 Tax=Clostridium sp. TaxID=1506 RepID=UPI003EE816CD
MKKKILLPLIFLIPFSFVACNNQDLSIKDPTRKESYAEIETKIKLKEFEDKIGLENLSELSANEILESSNLPLEEFIAIRETKINKDILNKDIIYQVIERAKYLSNLIYEEAKKEGTIAP